MFAIRTFARDVAREIRDGWTPSGLVAVAASIAITSLLLGGVI